MNLNTRFLIAWYRSALLAQCNTAIDFSKDPFDIITAPQMMEGVVDKDVAQNLFNRINQDRGADDQKTVAQVVLCAKTVKTEIEAAGKAGDLDELTGLYYIPALLQEDGRLLFDQENRRLPWFPREYLQPMIEPVLSIGHADDVDAFLSANTGQAFQMEDWEAYVRFFVRFYETVTGAEFDSHTVPNPEAGADDYQLERQVYLFEDGTVDASFHIRNLCNNLLENDPPALDLLERFAARQETPDEPLLETELHAMQRHHGQMSQKYPLSLSQREATTHFTAMADGDILAVNGPPGTGKTTLLQTVVANLLVSHALEEKPPPVIVAASTNNQAVTNIIESFGSAENGDADLLTQRWICGVHSLATYLPSASKMKRAQKKGYQYTNKRGEYFVQEVDCAENLEASAQRMLECCGMWFNRQFADVDACKEQLHQELTGIRKMKQELLALIDSLSQIRAPGETLSEKIGRLEGEVAALEAQADRLLHRQEEWRTYYAKLPVLYRILQFLPYFRKRLSGLMRLHISAEEVGILTEPISLESVTRHLADRRMQIFSEIGSIQKQMEHVAGVQNRLSSLLKDMELHRICPGEEMDADRISGLSLDEVNAMLDRTARYTSFWLAVHYYECRWLSGENALTEKQKGATYENVLRQFYRRLCMITPCLVTTFFMLPQHFQAWLNPGYTYLYRYIDLLIADEAGQVSPEAAAPSFALAVRSMVVGDVHQIEPVWGVMKAVDRSLALQCGLIDQPEEFEELEACGLTTSSSSVMLVASKSCRYRKFGRKGLFLSEHRRCYNDIIGYCNDLVYGGNLQPLRGPGKADPQRALPQWPQVAHRQIACEHSVRQGTSRMNRGEAMGIAAWLEQHLPEIIQAYPDDNPEELVGVITPFRAQKTCIRAELRRVPNGSLVSVGTVHTFQGAERRIILFSTVYGSADGCYFLDLKHSLMNVAVSRAKDHFFVFGEMECLQSGPGSASGLLRSYLAEHSVPSKTVVS